MRMISLVDYGMGNLRSVEKAFAQAGADVKLISTPEEVAAAEKLVVPGVGAFGDAMKSLLQSGVAEALKDAARDGKPLLGICLGAQLLFDWSEEDPEVPGLGIMRGGVKLFPREMGLKVPHMGWNTLHVDPESRVLAGLGDDPHVYFVHSYYMAPEDANVSAATTGYGLEFASAVEHDNVFGVQFHPEKSQDLGLRILRNFAGL
jgi:glutamine amidotransferase